MGLTLRMRGFPPSLAHTSSMTAFPQWKAEGKSVVSHCSVFLLSTSQNWLAHCLAYPFHVHFSPMSKMV